MFQVRKTTVADAEAIFNLYKKVASNVGGIARLENEVTEQYVEDFISRSLKSGIQLVGFNPKHPEEILAEIHCFKPEPSVFSHVLSEMTIVVDPKVQGKGLGKLLFNKLIEEIRSERSDILRLELIVRDSNHKAISFYRSINFRIEGRLERRIDSRNGKFEADIPMAWFNPDYKNPYLKHNSHHDKANVL